MTAKAVLNRFDPKGAWTEDVREFIDEDFEKVGTQFKGNEKADRTEGVDAINWHDKNAVKIPICRLVLRKPEL